MVVLEFVSKKQGKGVAITKAKMKNLLTGATIMESLQSGSRFEVFDTDWQVGTYTYRDEEANEIILMNMETFEEFRIPAGVIGDLGEWLSEGMELDFEMYDGKVVSTVMKGEIEMEITKIMSSKDSGKDCQLLMANGVVRTGPSYLKAGDKVQLDKVNFQFQKRV